MLLKGVTVKIEDCACPSKAKPVEQVATHSYCSACLRACPSVRNCNQNCDDINFNSFTQWRFPVTNLKLASRKSEPCMHGLFLYNANESNDYHAGSKCWRNFMLLCFYSFMYRVSASIFLPGCLQKDYFRKNVGCRVAIKPVSHCIARSLLQNVPVENLPAHFRGATSTL